jgi:DNA-binding NarL/FixJ family response regulator
LIDELDAVRNGKAMLDPSVTQQVINHVRHTQNERQATAFNGLSYGVMEVLAHITQGKSKAEIGTGMLLTKRRFTIT